MTHLACMFPLEAIYLRSVFSIQLLEIIEVALRLGNTLDRDVAWLWSLWKIGRFVAWASNNPHRWRRPPATTATTIHLQQRLVRVRHSRVWYPTTDSTVLYRRFPSLKCSNLSSGVYLQQEIQGTARLVNLDSTADSYQRFGVFMLPNVIFAYTCHQRHGKVLLMISLWDSIRSLQSYFQHINNITGTYFSEAFIWMAGVSTDTDDRQNISATLIREVGYFCPLNWKLKVSN